MEKKSDSIQFSAYFTVEIFNIWVQTKVNMLKDVKNGINSSKSFTDKAIILMRSLLAVFIFGMPSKIGHKSNRPENRIYMKYIQQEGALIFLFVPFIR